jgi:glutathione S-transferase
MGRPISQRRPRRKRGAAPYDRGRTRNVACVPRREGGVEEEITISYELFYWPGLPGRGEFIRLALEEAGAEYVDVARESGDDRGVPAMLKLMRSPLETHPPFAPPILRDGDVVVSHVANILMYLGPKLGLAPRDEAARWFAHALQLTITDVVSEAHDTHHPISTAMYYEQQKKPAKAAAAAFLADRMPKYLGYFETIVARNPAGPAQVVGDAVTYVDLSLFQLWEGLAYAFPRATVNLSTAYPQLSKLVSSVRARPRIAAYLKSPRRLDFNDSGVFRHYPELDADPPEGASSTTRRN